MLQIASYNIGGARKLRPAPNNPNRTGADAALTLSRHLDPDAPTVVLLQETGCLIRDNGQRSSAHDELADALHVGATYYARFAPELTSTHHPHARLWSREIYAGAVKAAEGNAFVTNMPFADWDWPTHGPFTDRWTWTQVSGGRLYSTGNRDTQPRNAVLASLSHAEYGPLFVMNTHLGTLKGEQRHDPQHPRTQQGEASRLRQAEQLLRMVDELRTAEQAHGQPPRPIILAGDFNAQPNAPTMQRLREVFALLPVDTPEGDDWTHIDHQIRIDHVLVSDPRGVLPQGRAFVQTALPFDDLSDHRPVIAVFGG